VTDAVDPELGRRAKAALERRGYSCPKCGADASHIAPRGIETELHPDAAGPHGIDTSYEWDVLYLTCSACGYDRIFMSVENIP
jgi:hypothetical protein